MITNEQLDNAKDAIRAVKEASQRITELLFKIDSTVLQDKDGTPIISLTVTQKSQLKAEYEKAKTALNKAVTELP